MQRNPSLATLALLWLAGNGLRLTILAVPPVITLIIADYRLTGTEVGVLNAIPVCLFALAAVPGSYLISRIGAVPAVITGLLIAATGSALRGFVPSTALLFAATVVMSAGVAIMQTSLPSTVRQWMPNHVGFGTAVYANGMIVGEILPVAFTVFVLPLVGGGWHLDLVFWSVPAAVIALILFLCRPRGAAGVSSTSRRWMPVWRDPLLWKLGLLLGGMNSLYFCSNTFLPSYLDQLNYQALTGPVLTALNLVQLPGSFLLLLIAGRLERKRWPLVATGLFGMLGVVAVLTASAPWQFVTGAAIIGLAGAINLTLTFALPALLVAPEDVSRLSAGMLTVSYGSSMFISVACGALWDFTQDAAFAFVPIVISLLPSIVLPLLLDLSGRRSGLESKPAL